MVSALERQIHSTSNHHHIARTVHSTLNTHTHTHTHKQSSVFDIESGCSAMDWVRVSSKLNVRGKTGARVFTRAEVAKHNTIDDAWTILRGRVFTITPYLRFHPGGISAPSPSPSLPPSPSPITPSLLSSFMSPFLSAASPSQSQSPSPSH